MLSICIPIYNQDVTALVSALSSQIAHMETPAEIILIDDCSTEAFKRINKTICKEHQYHELEQNVGRSKIRNLFLKYVNYDYLLFLDCDATIISEHLLEVYIDTITSNTYQVFCGGSIYPKEKPSREYMLRWANGNIRETIPAKTRKTKPYSSFMTSNVIIKRDVFDHIRFDENIVKYGHEDTLFGFALKKKGIPICHVDNNVLNDDIDANSTFIQKTEEALVNLAYIIKKLDYDQDLISEIKILNVYFSLQRKGLTSLLNIGFSIIKTPLKRLLSHGTENLYLFDIYKIGVLSKALKKNS